MGKDNDLTLSDEMIEAWHQGSAPTLELHEYLGLTFEESAEIFRDPEAMDAAVHKAMEALRAVHLDYTDRNDEHRMYCRADGQEWPCEDGRRAWHAVDPDEFPLIAG